MEEKKRNNLEELKLITKWWQHQDSIIWQRFSSFINIASIIFSLIGILSIFVITGINSLNNLIIIIGLLIISFLALTLSLLSLLWKSMFLRIHTYHNYYMEEMKKLQKKLNFKVVLEKEDIIFPKIARIRIITATKIIFDLFFILPLLLSIVIIGVAVYMGI